jgi:hypothetical protein
MSAFVPGTAVAVDLLKLPNGTLKLRPTAASLGGGTTMRRRQSRSIALFPFKEPQPSRARITSICWQIYSRWALCLRFVAFSGLAVAQRCETPGARA